MKADQSGSVIVSLKKGKVSGTNVNICLHMSLFIPPWFRDLRGRNRTSMFMDFL